MLINSGAVRWAGLVLLLGGLQAALFQLAFCINSGTFRSLGLFCMCLVGLDLLRSIPLSHWLSGIDRNRSFSWCRPCTWVLEYSNCTPCQATLCINPDITRLLLASSPEDYPKVIKSGIDEAGQITQNHWTQWHRHASPPRAAGVTRPQLRPLCKTARCLRRAYESFIYKSSSLARPKLTPAWGSCNRQNSIHVGKYCVTSFRLSPPIARRW